MKNNKAIIVVLFTLLIIFTLGSLNLFAAAKVYVNGIDADYPPFAYVDEKGNPAGMLNVLTG